MIVCNLPVLLAERRMKVADVVRATGMSKTTLHKLYNGQSTRIDFETLEKLCVLLNVEVGDLLKFKKNEEQNDWLKENKIEFFIISKCFNYVFMVTKFGHHKN